MTAAFGLFFDLLLLQRSTLVTKATKSCNLLHKMAVVCYDDECLRLCDAHNVANCVPFNVDINNNTNSSSSSSSSISPTKPTREREAWAWTQAHKWEMIAAAFAAGAPAVLYADVDVLLLRDPTPHVGTHDVSFLGGGKAAANMSDCGAFADGSFNLVYLKDTARDAVVDLARADRKEALLRAVGYYGAASPGAERALVSAAFDKHSSVSGSSSGKALRRRVLDVNGTAGQGHDAAKAAQRSGAAIPLTRCVLPTQLFRSSQLCAAVGAGATPGGSGGSSAPSGGGKRAQEPVTAAVAVAAADVVAYGVRCAGSLPHRLHQMAHAITRLALPNVTFDRVELGRAASANAAGQPTLPTAAAATVATFVAPDAPAIAPSAGDATPQALSSQSQRLRRENRGVWRALFVVLLAFLVASRWCTASKPQ